MVRISDEAMAPTLTFGGSALVDRRRRAWRVRSIVAVRIDGAVTMRRADHGKDGRRLMVSDNPAWPTLPLPDGAEILGQVVCEERGI